jgi:hypothetical protein
MSKKINHSVLEKRWPRHDTNAENDPYETPTLAYNREMDQLVVANTVNNEMEEENIPGLDDEEESEGPKTTLLGDTMTKLDEEEEKPTTLKLVMDEELEEPVTLRSKMGLNIVNNTPRKIGSTHSI